MPDPGNQSMKEIAAKAREASRVVACAEEVAKNGASANKFIN